MAKAIVIGEANMINRGGFTEKLNKKFAHHPIAAEDLHVALNAGQDLQDIFCFEQTRSVAQDWVVHNENRFYQLSRNKGSLPRAGSKVTVQVCLDGSLYILNRGRRISHKEFDPQLKVGRKVI